MTPLERSAKLADRLVLRLTLREALKIERIARREGMPKSVWVRIQLRKAVLAHEVERSRDGKD